MGLKSGKNVLKIFRNTEPDAVVHQYGKDYHVTDMEVIYCSLNDRETPYEEALNVLRYFKFVGTVHSPGLVEIIYEFDNCHPAYA